MPHRSWFAAVLTDVKMLAKSEHLAEFDSSSMPKLWETVSCQPGRFKKCAALAARDDLVLAAALAQHKAVPLDPGAHPCGLCAASFATKQALSVHAFRKHGARRETRTRVDEPSCVACLQAFGTRERLIAHLEDKSPRCRAIVLATLPPLPAERLAEITAEDAEISRGLARGGRRRVDAATPAVRLQGPLIAPAAAAGISHATGLRTQTNACYF